MPLSRLLGAACTLVFGGVSAAIGWRAGHLLAQAPAAGELPLGLSDGDLLGAAGVAAVAFSAVLLNLAVRAWRGGAPLRALLGACLWLLLAFYASGNAVKFSAYHRAETTRARILAADRYDDGREQLRAARQKLSEIEKSPVLFEHGRLHKDREPRNQDLMCKDCSERRSGLGGAAVQSERATGRGRSWLPKPGLGYGIARGLDRKVLAGVRGARVRAVQLPRCIRGIESTGSSQIGAPTTSGQTTGKHGCQ
jgi:hypothetical protein